MNEALPQRAQFHHMKEGTQSDWEIIGANLSGEIPLAVAVSIFCCEVPSPVKAFIEISVETKPGQINVTAILVSYTSARKLSKNPCRACFDAA